MRCETVREFRVHICVSQYKSNGFILLNARITFFSSLAASLFHTLQEDLVEFPSVSREGKDDDIRIVVEVISWRGQEDMWKP